MRTTTGVTSVEFDARNGSRTHRSGALVRSLGRPISSNASRLAVSSNVLSSRSTLPPGKDVSPAYDRSCEDRLLSSTYKSPCLPTNKATSTAALLDRGYMKSRSGDFGI